MIHKSTFFLLLGSLILFNSCKDSVVDKPLGNKAPSTKVFLTPDSTVSKQQSKLHMHWTGDDPDGMVIGYYFTWNDTNWTFTTANDSLFTLKIGATDAKYTFRVASVDNSGNGQYDNAVIQNGINFGPEPFTDLNGNGKWDVGEPYTDIGLIDPHPASIQFPITNTAPVLTWNVLSTVPDTTFAVMSFGWNVTDLDGESTIANIRVALNDTNNYVSIDGAVRNITIRPGDNTSSPKMEMLLNGNSSSILPVKIPGLVYNSSNVLYIQAIDIAGATSAWVSTKTQNTSHSWYVKKPKGKLLIVDDYNLVESPVNASANFYNAIMDSLGMTGQFDVYDIKTQVPPYINATFYETLKLFGYTLWYSDYNTPSVDLASSTVQKYLNFGGKLFFSMQFPTIVDLGQLSGFMPIQTDTSAFKTFAFKGTKISAANNDASYPDLIATATVNRVRTFHLQTGAATPVYYFPNNELGYSIGFKNSDNNLFFIGLPLHLMDATAGSVTQLLNKVFIQDFKLTK